MKYLVTSHSRVPAARMEAAPEMAKAILKMNRAAKKWVEEEKKAGRLIDAWAKTDNSGCVWLWDVESNYSLFNKLNENPAASFVDYTVTPVIDMEKALETLFQRTKRLIKE